MAARRNRRGRRRNRGRFSALYKLLSVLIIFAAILMGCVVFFRVSTVEITGDSPYTEEEIRRVSGVEQGVNLFTLGFPTDAQAPLMAALTRGKGCTVFVENIFESRYRHVDELSRMGADIRVEGRVAVVYGVPRLHGAQVRATDLRGGAALAVAALGAEGRSELTGVHHIDRGYQSLEGDLRRLGAEIRRI